jgi:Flp pilus assembly secretin CpaC
MSKLLLKKMMTNLSIITMVLAFSCWPQVYSEDGTKSSVSNFFKKVFTHDKKSQGAEEIAPASSENTANLGPDSETIEKIVEQKSVMDQRKLQKGKIAHEKGTLLYHQFKFSEAATMFQEALIYLPDDESSQNYLGKCRQILGVGQQNASTVTQWMGEQQEVVVQELKTISRFHREKAQTLKAEATRLWAEQAGNDQALKKLEESRYEMRRAKATMVQLPPGESKPQELASINEDLTNIDALEVSWKAYIQKKVEEAARQKSIELSEQSKQYEGSRLDNLLNQVRRLYIEEKYEESENLCMLILNEWPKNEDARLILKRSVARKNEKLSLEIKAKSKEEWRRNLEKIRDSSVAYSEWLTYSDDWLEIEKRRKVVGEKESEDPEWTKLIRQKMESLVTIHLPDDTLKVALDRMQEQTGVNFIIDQALAAELSESRITEFHINSTRCSAVLELLLSGLPTRSGSPLIYQYLDGAVFVTSKENQNLFDRPEIVIYDVTDLITPFGENSLDANDSLKSGAAVSGTDAESRSQPLSTDTLMDLIKSSIAPETWQSEGVNMAKYEEGKLLVSHSSEVLGKIAELLEMFRKQQRLQVSIETRFITSTDDDLFDVGVEWKGLDEISLEDVTTVGAGAYSSRSNTGADTRVATVLGSAADSVVAGAPVFTTENRSTQGLNMEFSVLDPLRASIVLHALARKQTTKSLLAPRLTVINNQQGYFISSVEEGYVRTYTSEDGNIIPQPERVSSGQLLVVRPTVSSDRKYITLDLSPQITRVLALEQRPMTVPVRRRTGNGNNGSSVLELVSVTIELPSVEVWQLQTRVQVPDGGIVFVGGRMGNTARKSTRAVPLISKIPLIGRLFRSDGDYASLDNLIISVQAKILVFDELESKLH